MADLARWCSEKDLRVFGRCCERSLLNMHLKVQSQRPYRMRVGDHRIERNIIERDVCYSAIHSRAHALEPVIQLQDLFESTR